MTDFTIPTNIDVNQVIVDAIPPTILSAVTMDANPVDGRIDYYKITFSEPVLDSSFPGYVPYSVGSSQTTWSVAGYNNVVLGSWSCRTGNRHR